MIIRCTHCGKPMSTVLEYNKKKKNLDKSWRWDGEVCFNCLVDFVNGYQNKKEKR